MEAEELWGGGRCFDFLTSIPLASFVGKHICTAYGVLQAQVPAYGPEGFDTVIRYRRRVLQREERGAKAALEVMM